LKNVPLSLGGGGIRKVIKFAEKCREKKGIGIDLAGKCGL
jgi:hypothetical protein